VKKGCSKSITKRFVNVTVHQIWLGWSYFDMRINKEILLGKGYARNSRGAVGRGVYYVVRAKVIQNVPQWNRQTSPACSEGYSKQKNLI
jgi:hypothetical protein